MSRKIKVRIAVVVDELGQWNSLGWSDAPNDCQLMSDTKEPMNEGPHAEYWVTAELEVPETVEVAGKVESV